VRAWTGPPTPEPQGEFLPEIKEILTIAAESRITITPGHKTPERNSALVRGCREAGARVLITHAQTLGAVVGSGTVQKANEMMDLRSLDSQV